MSTSNFGSSQANHRTWSPEGLAAPGQTNGLKSPRYLGLQVLRVIAALLVVYTHSTFYTSERLAPTFPIFHGEWGVDLFFTISGFVMISSSRRLLGTVDGWRVFAMHRIVRIVPVYWLALIIKLIVMMLSTHLVLHTKFSLWKTICSFLFVPTMNIDGEIRPLLGVGWTLNFEMFFYALFTVALLLRRNVYVFLGIVFGLIAIASYFRQSSWPVPVFFYTHTIVLEFYFGMLVAKLSADYRKPRAIIAWSMIIVGFALFSYNGSAGALLPQAVRDGIPAVLIVWGAVSVEQYLKQTPRYLLFLADASYVLYLFHPLVAPIAPAIFMKLHLSNLRFSVLCSVFLALSASSLIHQYVESPMTGWFRRNLQGRARIGANVLKDAQ